jgi:hypothetical protein
MIIAGTNKDLIATVHSQINGTQISSGVMWCVVRLEDSGVNDGKYWDNGGTWETSPSVYPSGTHLKGGQWSFTLPGLATSGYHGSTIHFTYTNNLNEILATSVCAGAEHYVRADVPVIPSDVHIYELEAT